MTRKPNRSILKCVWIEGGKTKAYKNGVKTDEFVPQ